MRWWKFRSAERDKLSDAARFASVSLAVSSALGSLQAEKDGLQERLNKLRARLGSMYGTQDGYYEPREAAQEKELAEAERLMMRAFERLKELDAELCRFRSVERFVQGVAMLPDTEASAPGHEPLDIR